MRHLSVFVIRGHEVSCKNQVFRAMRESYAMPFLWDHETVPDELEPITMTPYVGSSLDDIITSFGIAFEEWLEYHRAPIEGYCPDRIIINTAFPQPTLIPAIREYLKAPNRVPDDVNVGVYDIVVKGDIGVEVTGTYAPGRSLLAEYKQYNEQELYV